MLDIGRLRQDFCGFAATEWLTRLERRSRARVADGTHGNLPHWRRILESLPKTAKNQFRVDRGAVTVDVDWDETQSGASRELLLQLAPWRKGPFQLGDIRIDTEWRSELKWQRVREAIQPLQDRSVLDVGCGNGYYALCMRDCGARRVLGIDPTLLFVAQFSSITHFIQSEPVYVLPLRLQELPAGAAKFDTTFSMGVLYHQREPIDHLTQLRDTLCAGGELVLETLIAPGGQSEVLIPQQRYARMRNVWHLPTRQRLVEWLGTAGFTGIRVVDESHTTQDEQRSTEWMPFESLREALDPHDPSRTIEGLPAPLRIVVLAEYGAAAA